MEILKLIIGLVIFIMLGQIMNILQEMRDILNKYK